MKPRVTQIVSYLYPFDKDGFARWCYDNFLSPDEVMRVSEKLGNEEHEKFEKGFYDDLIREEFGEFETVKSEGRVLHPDFQGTYDKLIKVKDKLILIDAKTFGAWRKELLKESDYLAWCEKSKDLSCSADKLKKLRIQGGGYKLGLEHMGFKVDELYCFHIHPEKKSFKKVTFNTKRFMQGLNEYLIYSKIKKITQKNEGKTEEADSLDSAQEALEGFF